MISVPCEYILHTEQYGTETEKLSVQLVILTL